ncbi:MAG TPA: metallophosphoesterase [Caulobacteraceae bacterium]|jgi:3',5'-cyclic AMP phosphodiesterase CpdA
MIVRIAHLSDIHFGGELTQATEAALKAVADFDPTVVAVTGDLTLNGLPREFRAARDWLSRLGRPTVVTPGNHDTPYWNLPLRALRPFERYERYIGPAVGAAYDAPHVSVRALNSARGAQPRFDWSKGAIALDKLRRIQWGTGARVFACHHPLMDLAGAPVTGGVRGGVLAGALLAEAGVELVLTGHVHVPFAAPLTVAPPICYAIGAGTLSRRLRGAPASYSTIAVTQEAFEVTVQAWTGEHFQTQQSWRLARASSLELG